MNNQYENNNYKNYIYATIINYICNYFKFSSQIAEESDDISNGVLRKIIDVFHILKD